MSNAIAQARADVAAALGTITNLQVWQFFPENLEAPAAVITSGDPYVTAGKALGEYAITLGVRLFVDGGNQTATESLDELIVNVSEALRQDFGLVQASTIGKTDEYSPSYHLVSDITINPTYYNNGGI